jgi:hypothetical protein
MPKHIRAGALTVLAITAATLGTTLSVQASAEAAPNTAAKAAAWPPFLSAAELPKYLDSTWTTGKITGGVPEELQFCLGDALLAYNLQYREYRTDLEASARQLTIVVGDDAKAAALAKRLNKDFRSCAEREQSDPEIVNTYRDFGTLPVEEGARVHGVQTTTAWGAMDVNLLSVGRDGGTVTVVDWGQMGDFGDAPVKAFKKTTTTAANKLH